MTKRWLVPALLLGALLFGCKSEEPKTDPVKAGKSATSPDGTVGAANSGNELQPNPNGAEAYKPGTK